MEIEQNVQRKKPNMVIILKWVHIIKKLSLELDISSSNLDRDIQSKKCCIYQPPLATGWA